MQCAQLVAVNSRHFLDWTETFRQAANQILRASQFRPLAEALFASVRLAAAQPAVVQLAEVPFVPTLIFVIQVVPIHVCTWRQVALAQLEAVAAEVALAPLVAALALAPSLQPVAELVRVLVAVVFAPLVAPLVSSFALVAVVVVVAAPLVVVLVQSLARVLVAAEPLAVAVVLVQLVAAALAQPRVLAAWVELEFLEPAVLAWQLSQLELV
jgi:hypothetical protein